MKRHRGTSQGNISFYVAKLCTGAGVLGLPFAFQQCGIIVACAIVVFCIALNSFGCHLLVACKSMLSEMPEVVQRQSRTRDTYAMVAQVAMGQAGIHLVDAAILVTLFGAAALYQVTVSALLVQVYPGLSQHSYVLICAALLLPFIFIRDIGALAYVSGIAVFAYLVAFAGIFFYGAGHHDFVMESWQFMPTAITPTAVTESFGVVCFSLGIPILCFTLQESMENPSRFGRVLDLTLAAVALGYVAIGIVGVGLFSHVAETGGPSASSVNEAHGVEPIILTNIPGDSVVGLIVKVIVAAVLLLTSPMTFVPALGLLEGIVFGHDDTTATIQSEYKQSETYGTVDDSDEFGERKTLADQLEEQGATTGNEDSHSFSHHLLSPGRIDHRAISDEPIEGIRLIGSPDVYPGEAPRRTARALLRLLMLLLVAMVATYVPCFTLLMSLIGCVTLNILSFILPPLFYIRLRQVRKSERPDLASSWASWLCACGCVLFLGFGACSLAGTTWLVLTQGKCQ